MEGKKVMRIGFFHNFNSYKANRGYAVHVQQMSSALIKRGHSISVYYGWDENPEFRYYRKRHFFRFLKDIDLIYIRLSGYMENYSLLKLLRPFSLPVVWELNAPLEEARVRDDVSEDEIKKCFKRRKRLARLTDACICVSEELRDHSINKLGIKNSFVVENGSNPDLFSPEKKNPAIYGAYKDKFKVIWMGRARSPWQKVDIVLDVAKRIQKIDRDVIFVIIGDTNGMKLELSENVLLMDSVEYSRLASFVASSDIGLSLYNDIRPLDGHRFYGSSIKLFDYMACGLPVISTGLGQINKIVRDGENGLLTDNGSEDIVKKILRLKNNSGYAKDLGSSARREIVDYYNWDRAARQTEEIFLRLC